MSDARLNPRGEDPGGRGLFPLGRVLEDPVDERSVPRMWRRIVERRAGPLARHGAVLGWALLGAAVAIACMALLLVAERWTAPVDGGVAAGALVRSNGKPLEVVDAPSDGESVSVELSDKSRIVLSPGGRLEPLASSGREFIVRLASGKALFNVEPFGPRRWVVEAGLASVEVVGTRFTVTRRAEAVRVEVDHGIVLVRGASLPDGITRLDAGGTVEVLAKPEPRAPEPTTVAPHSEPVAATPPRGSSAPTGADKWRRDAARGDYASAYGDLGIEGLRRETALAASGDDLFSLADVARLSGHPAEAVGPLERLETEFASSPRAPLAAVTLGRIQLDLGNAPRAQHAFERALAIGVPAGLEEDVYARLVEAHVRAGDRVGARSVREAYARKFPTGRRMMDIDRWIER